MLEAAVQEYPEALASGQDAKGEQSWVKFWNNLIKIPQDGVTFGQVFTFVQ